MKPRKAPTFTYDPNWKPKINRKTGRANWDSPWLQARIRVAFEAGQSIRDMADAWGIKYHALFHHLYSRGMTSMPADRLGIAEVAAALNLTEIGVHALCKREQVDMGHWGKFRTLTPEQLAQLQSRPRIVRERPSGYVTTADLAVAWGLAETTVRARVMDLPRLAWVGDGPRVKYLYLLRDATTRAPTVGQSACPAGHWTGAELAAAIGVNPGVIGGWPGLGCPCIKGRKNRYYRPVAVAEWLRTRRKAPMRAHGLVLELALSAQRAA